MHIMYSSTCLFFDDSILYFVQFFFQRINGYTSILLFLNLSLLLFGEASVLRASFVITKRVELRIEIELQAEW